MRSATLFICMLVLIGDGYIRHASGCFANEKDEEVVKNIQLQGIDGAFARCVLGGTAACRIRCNVTIGEIQDPPHSFQALSLCNNYTQYYVCYGSSSDLSSFSCASDIPGCSPTTKQRLGRVAFQSLGACFASLPTGFVICADTETKQYSCEFNNPGCTSPFRSVTSLEYPVSTFSDISSCLTSLALGQWQRCVSVPMSSTSPAKVTCVLGVSTAVCPKGTILLPPDLSFPTEPDCLVFQGVVQCYSRTLNVYTCRTDTYGCEKNEIQITTSMPISSCPTTQPASTVTAVVRCATDSSATCRPAETVTFADDGTIPTQKIMSPLSNACLAGETLLPPIALTPEQCLGYGGRVWCYDFTSGTLGCIRDYMCIGSDLKVITSSDLSNPDKCQIYMPTSYYRCGSIGTEGICRPVEAGCAPGESQNPASTAFPSLDSCNKYELIPSRWLRCQSSTGIYCSYQNCSVSDRRLGAEGTTTTYTSQSDCENQLFWTRLCYTALSTPTADNLYYTITMISETAGGSCPPGTLTLNEWLVTKTTPNAETAKTFYETVTLPHSRCNVGGTPVCRPDMDLSTATTDCYGTEAKLQTSNTPMSLEQCNAQLYLGSPCYNPTSTDPYYTIVPGWDTTTPVPGTCTVGQLRLSTKMYSGETQAAVTELVRADYTESLQLTHYRCTPGGVAICRPDMDTSTAGAQCAISLGENLAPATASPLVGYNSLGACKAVLLQGKVCYLPQDTPPYYTIVAALDTDSPPGVCKYPAVAIPGAPGYIPAPTPGDLTSKVETAYVTVAATHYRCNKDGTVICRPDTDLLTLGPQCFSSEIILTSTTTMFPDGTFPNLDTCNNNILFGVPCYAALGSSYQIIAGLDTTTPPGWCANGQAKLTATYYSAKSKADLDVAVATFYTEDATVNHYRCTYLNIPVCRPDISTDPGVQCPSSEYLAPATASPPTQYSTLRQCKLQLYWGLPCYVPNQSSSPFYAIVGALDTNQNSGVCPSNAVPITGLTNFYPGTSQDAVNTAATAAYEQSTIVNHVRCKVGSSPVCRPQCFNHVYVPSSEIQLTTRATTGPSFTSLSNCNANKYFAVMCYNANSADPSQTSCAQDVDGCDTNFTPILSFGGSDSSSTPYTACQTDATPMWIRCGKTDGSSSSALCRPLSAGCVASETRIFESTVTKTVIDCRAIQKYVTCYDASVTTGTPFSCPNDYKLCPSPKLRYPFSAATTVDTVKASDSDCTSPTSSLLSLTYYRCNNGGTVTCRPDMDPSTPSPDCFGGEKVLLTVTAATADGSFTSFQACQNNAYVGVPCYQATTTPPYYAIVAGLDTATPPGSCASGEIKLSTTLYSAKSITDLNNAVSAAYGDTTNLPHFRCKYATQPVCRPDMDVTTPGVQCAVALQETLAIATASPLVTYPNLQSCLSKLYWGVPCYVPNQNAEPFYTFVGALDTATSPGVCLTGSVPITELTSYYSGASTDDLGNACKNAYETAASVRHVRCKLGIIPVCRPQCFSTPVVPTNELQLSTVAATGPTYTSLSSCMNSRYFALLCYNQNLVDPSLTTCNSDAVGCSTNFIAVSYFGGRGTPSQVIDDCNNDATPMWSRCGKNDGTAATALCRPSSICLSGETRIYRSTQLISRASCASTTAYITCYDTTSVLNQGTRNSPFSCPNDYQLCPSPLITYPLSSTVNDVTLTNPPAKCPPVAPASYFRCKSAVYITCRPSDIGCNSAKENPDGGPFPDQIQCLDGGATYCSCSFSGCNLRVAGKCCQGGTDLQVPNDATFYAKATCT